MEDWILNQMIQKSIDDATPEEWDRASMSDNQLLKCKDGFSWPYQASKKASSKQIGGDHYKGLSIQPAEFCHRNNIPYLEATAIKYLCRWRSKGGVQDLDKAIHFIELLKEYESLKDK
jgi:hypothetical protein